MSRQPASIIEPFVAFGRELDAAFRRANYSEEAFAELAAEHLARVRLYEGFDLSEFVRWAALSNDFPWQEDLAASFGEPPLTLWAGRRFYISALVWRSSTTAIHQHAFSGAFQVLKGGSVHTRYAFEPKTWITEELGVGELRCLGA